jgi:hypothetical protein
MRISVTFTRSRLASLTLPLVFAPLSFILLGCEESAPPAGTKVQAPSQEAANNMENFMKTQDAAKKK